MIVIIKVDIVLLFFTKMLQKIRNAKIFVGGLLF